MRQGHHQNRRSRGRNNNNRKGHNPLTRSFESNGPDVKIRGTPAHIAEKYMSLARDALSSDDPVLAENYLQHAEHYNRIIMAYREQQFPQGGGDIAPVGGGRFGIPPGHDDDFGDDGDDYSPEAGGGQQQVRGFEQQPQVAGAPRFEGDRPDREPRERDRDRRDRFEDRQRRHEHRHDRNRDRDRDRNREFDRDARHQQGADRQPDVAFPVGDQPALNVANGSHAEAVVRPERPERQERAERPERHERAERHEPRTERPERGEPSERLEGASRRRRDRFGVGTDQQPEFLRRSVRRPRSDAEQGEKVEPAVVGHTGGDEPPRD